MYDLVVIGAGPGGYVAAIRASQLGMKVALIEKRKTLGGTCLNVGCIPSKALLQDSELYALVQSKGGELPYTLDSMMSRKEEVVASLTSGVSSLMQKNKITCLQGEASFIDPHTLQVGVERVEGKNILIATGSEPIELPFLPFDEEKIVSSTGALSLKEVPQKLAVVGGGVIGMELASVYCRLGSEVTIIEMMERLIPMMDADICKAFTNHMKKMGMEILTKTKVLGAEGTTLQLEGQEIAADIVLVGVGRKPYTKGLNLEAAGIAPTKEGRIAVNGAFQSSASHILAIGDVIDGPMLAHKASEEGVAAVEILAGERPQLNYLAIPNVIYTHPEVASVGLTEEEAKNSSLQLLKGKAFFKGNARARCAEETEGFVKILGEKSSGKLIGMHIFGAHASELISEGALAMQKGATVRELAETPAAHPTLSEAIKEAALSALGRIIHG